jgi:hypothetical protein
MERAMKREEYEKILKRSLELKSLQHDLTTSEFSEEDLKAAGERLGIPPEVLQQASREIANQHKHFRLAGTPEEVREAFLRHFLMQETSQPIGRRIPGTPLKIDRDSLKGGPNQVRVVQPLMTEMHADLNFIPDGEGHTLVSWTGEFTPSTRTMARHGFLPLIIILATMIPMMMSGAGFAPFLITAGSLLFMLFIVGMGFKRQGAMLEETLETYFANRQVLDDLEAKKSLQKEVAQLRSSEKAAQPPAMPAPVAKTSPGPTGLPPGAPIPAPLPEAGEEAPDESSARRPPQGLRQ